MMFQLNLMAKLLLVQKMIFQISLRLQSQQWQNFPLLRQKISRFLSDRVEVNMLLLQAVGLWRKVMRPI
nr:MAG TPA: hypothetical protein [Caudoviricetes sp.]